MRFRLSRVGGALVAAAFLLTTGPVSANPIESQDNSLQSQLERAVAQLKVDSDRAIAAAAEAASSAVEEGKDALAEAEKSLVPSLQTFLQTLNEQKARLAMIGEDAAARFDAWKQAAAESWAEAWSESWSDTWANSWAEMQRSASQTLDRFRDWMEKQSYSEKTEIPV